VLNSRLVKWLTTDNTEFSDIHRQTDLAKYPNNDSNKQRKVLPNDKQIMN